MSQNVSDEAIDWFVSNELNREQDEASWQRWEKWRVRPSHSAEYVRTLDFIQELRNLDPPSPASRKALLEDAALDRRY